MKSMKTKHPRPTPTLSVPMPPEQVAALRVLTRATGDQNDGRVASKVLALGLFVLGVDQAGDFCLSELTDALYGKGTKESAGVSEMIEDAGSEAWCHYVGVQHDERARAVAEASR